MTRSMSLRLLLDMLAGGLLLFCFAYWWLGNAAHEVAGAAIFGLLVLHNLIQRRWYRAWPRIAARPAGRVDLFMTIALLAMILVLLVTSVLISHFLADWIGWDVVDPRRLHALVGWWTLVLVAAHLGLRWPIVLNAVGRLLPSGGERRWRHVSRRILVVLIAVLGLWSAAKLNLPAKLTLQMSLDGWDFERRAGSFFMHGLAVVGLVAATTYYGVKALKVGVGALRRGGG